MARKPKTPAPHRTVYDHLHQATNHTQAALNSLADADDAARELGPQFSVAHRAGLKNVRTAVEAARLQLAALAMPPGQPPSKPLTPPPG